MAGTLQVDLVEKLKTGGQGEIWKGRLNDGTIVAVKIPLPSPTSVDPDADRRRFEREIRCQTALHHSGIVRVIATGRKDGEPFYVMPWADETLRTRLRDPAGPPLPSDAVALFSKIVDAMAYAHEEGVLHRDLKPENILLMNGEPKLADFGLGRQVSSESATITVTNAILGTLEYMPPEQYGDGHSATKASDVYSLGKIFYELLTGRIPFPIMDESLIPEKYRYFISKCTEYSPEKRFRDATEMSAQLALLQSGTFEIASPTTLAKSILEDIQFGNLSAYDKLTELLLQNQSDSNLFLGFLPYLPENIVEGYGKFHEKDFIKLISIFLEYVDGHHPYSFTDVLADFLEHAYWSINSIACRKDILCSLILLGHRHHRFHVGDVTVAIIRKTIEQEHFNSMVADALNEHPTEASFIVDGLLNLSLPKVVRDVLEAQSSKEI